MNSVKSFLRPASAALSLRQLRLPMQPMTVQLSRSFSSPSSSSTTPPLNPEYTEGERDIHLKLVKAFEPASLMVKDISGGCGSMYAVDIASKKFKGLNLVKQHRLVTEVLKEDIKDMHGIQIKTTAA